jgi:iron complex outermembrane receptor protein
MSKKVYANHGIRAVLLGGACMLAIAAVPASAQSVAANDQVESVTVTGLINSLQKNLDIKRDSPGLVDAISMEDIGKFPDSDIAAALQHVPGVTVSRGTSSMGGVPTSTGTATQITVRGFGPAFNETLYDGRKMSSGTGRSFDFSAVSADFVSEIDVLKSPDASLSAGAIGATINIKYPKPFDHPGLQLVGSVNGTISPEQGDPMPSADFLFSDTFNHDTFGILVDAAYTSNRTRGNHVNIQGWEGTYLDPCQRTGGPACGATLTGDAKPAWFIQDYGLYQETTTDTRLDGRLAMQWRPAESVLVTVNDDYSRDTLHQVQYGYSVWFNSGSLRNVSTAPDGTISSFVQNGTPTDFQSQINGSVLQNNEYGINVKWDVTSKFGIMLDADQALSQLNPGGQLSSIDADVGYGPSTPGGTNASNIGITLPGGHALPFPTGVGPNGNAGNFLGNGIIGSHVLPIGQNNRVDKVQQFKAEGTWTENDHLKITFGYQYVGDHDNARNYDDFANNDWQAYAGYGPASNNNGTHGAALPQEFFTSSFSTGSSFINGWNGNGLPPAVLAFNPYKVLNYLQGLGNPQNTAIPGYNVGCCNPAFDGVYRTILNAGSYQQIIENSNSAYVSLSTDTNIASMPLKINIGVRQEFTNLTAIGIGQQPTALTVQPSDHTAFVTTFGPQAQVTGKNSYQYLLPNLDLNLQVADDLQVRFDASRTLTRPALGQITPVLNVPTSPRVNALTATGGNPGLMPYLSDSVDLGAEWYYAQNSYASIDVFNKNVTNFIVGGTVQQGINGVIDPTTGLPAVFSVTSQVNGPTANVYGAEFAVQHVFGDSGFGLQANATVVGTNKPYNPNDLTVSGFAVTGLADSANLVAFYEMDGFQARVAANWRDAYLDHFGQQQNGSKFGTEPTFVNANTQIDFSTSYDITSQFNVYFTAQNLNDATFSTHGRFSEQLLDVVDYGRRFTLGLHFKL